MRAALPAEVPFADAVHNVGAAALAVAALSQGRLDLLSAATVDRLHEPYRAAAYPELPGARRGRPGRGRRPGACLSGAGSTVIAFSQDPAAAATIAAAMERRALELGMTGRALVQAARAEGARVVASGVRRPGARPALT